MPVRTPSRMPMPTANSPHVTINEKKPAFGSTKFFRKSAYQPWTAGLAPDDFASAPLTNPFNATPLVPHAGDSTFSHPAVNHCAPTFIRTTNQSAAAPVEPKKKREIAGSGKRSFGVVASKAARSRAKL